ncbi:MAG: hypothetical protein ABSH38_14775 [Verrucomicrobiota bacterium]
MPTIQNIFNRYVYPGFPGAPNLFQTRTLSIVPYGTGLNNPSDTYAKEIAWGNAFDMSTIPWGDTITATFTDTSGSPTSVSAPFAGLGYYSCNNSWFSPDGTMGIVDWLITGPCNVVAVKIHAYGDWSGDPDGPCYGGDPCPQAGNCEPRNANWIVAMEGCWGTFPLHCIGSASGPCLQQIIHQPMDGEIIQPCGGICKAGILRGLWVPMRNAGDGSDISALLDDFATTMASTICGTGVTVIFDSDWDDTVQCAVSGSTNNYSDPP